MRIFISILGGAGGYDPLAIAGIETIAHELTHTQQYKNYKTITGFGWDYWGEYEKNKDKGMSDSDAYTNISFEVNARSNAAIVINSVKQKYDNNQPCMFDSPNVKKPKGYSQEVYNLQAILLYLGYLTNQAQVEGVWGNITEGALKKFQARNGIKIDGIIGDQVKRKMAQPLGSLVRAK